VLAKSVGAALSSWLLLLAPLAAQNQEAVNPSPDGRLPSTHGRAQTISADLLRHPISSKTRVMLQRALDWMGSGKHHEAIHQLENTLAKDPSSAAYVHSLLGFEYMQTDQFAASVNSFEQAVSLLPHDAINHANFAISLSGIGDYKRAEAEARRALQLAPDNPEIQRLLDALLNYKRSIAQRQ
jgi:Tfp pilus assembly protein PilF